MTDPVRRLRLPLKDRPSFYVTIICFTITILAFVWLQVSLHDEGKQRTQQLQDVICGVYVPIGNTPVQPNLSPLGRTIVAATHHGAVRIHCPGIKP